jgi:predicted nucleotidyltransferase
MALKPGQIVNKYVSRYYPDADVVVLAGSAASGKAAKGSDLDVLVFDRKTEDSYRRIDKKYGAVIEVFAVSIKHFPFFLEEARKSAIPSMVRMCLEGIVLVDRGPAAELIEQAQAVWLEGPYPWTLDRMNQARYELTEYAADLIQGGDSAENPFIFNKLFELAAEFALRVNNRWLGVGKWAFRELTRFDPLLARDFVGATELFYKTGSGSAFVDLVNRMLEPYGGTLREGWVEIAALPEEEGELDEADD